MERHAFDAAVSRYSRRVFTFASYLLGNTSEAEDVVQDVLIKLWKRGGTVDPDRLGRVVGRLGDLDLDEFMTIDSDND